MDIKNNYELEQRSLEEKILRRRAERRRANRRRVQRNRIIAVIILLVMIFLICRSCTNTHKNKEKDSNNATAVNVNVSSENTSDSQIVDFATDDLSNLRTQINTAVESYSGTWSVYVKNLNTGYSISINDRQVYAASEIKLYALAAAYQQISDGILVESDTYTTLYLK